MNNLICFFTLIFVPHLVALIPKPLDAKSINSNIIFFLKPA